MRIQKVLREAEFAVNESQANFVFAEGPRSSFLAEALASMGAIARCTIFSRAEGAELGCRIENEGGRITEPVQAGGPGGTSIEVRDLFFNTPARRQFLKRKETELSRCLDVIQRAAGFDTRTTTELIEVIQRQAPGTWLPLEILRDGEALDVTARFPQRFE